MEPGRLVCSFNKEAEGWLGKSTEMVTEVDHLVLGEDVFEIEVGSMKISASTSQKVNEHRMPQMMEWMNSQAFRYVIDASVEKFRIPIARMKLTNVEGDEKTALVLAQIGLPTKDQVNALDLSRS